MKIVHYPEGLPLEEYLATEQRLLAEVSEPVFFTWVVSPTVIYGKHQIREQEVNEPFCAQHHIRIVQRQSGGGCVYADEGNLMVSFVTPDTHSEAVFAAYLHTLAEALRLMGYPAVTTSHNDVLVNERKVAGTACYTSTKGTIVHACILYKVNLEMLESAITPSETKLAKHAVTSVRQRVRNLADISDLGDIQSFRTTLENTIHDKIVND